MKPGAHIQALQEILNMWETQNAPLDYVLRTYYHNRRYMGSNDRRTLSETLFRLIRRLTFLDWWIDRLQLVSSDRQRWRVILFLLQEEGHTLTTLEELFNGAPYHSPAFTDQERQIIETFLASHQDSHLHLPRWVTVNCPQWLYEVMQASFDDDLDNELMALNKPASLDVRVNTLKSTGERVSAQLHECGLTAEPTPFSPIGLRLARGAPLVQCEAYQKGWIEIQDEGSQLIALLVDAKPGQAVLDYCAGGGGKALAIAAAMDNKGRLVAMDIADTRLREAQKRFERAGVTNAVCQLLPKNKAENEVFDRVLVDAPCSGTGTWRRNPDLKFRLTPARLEELTQIQNALLNDAAAFVAAKGRLIYATCSLLREENERQIERFLSTHPEFTILPYGQVWQSIFQTQAPTGDDLLCLTPAQHHTDGFFVAILERSAH